MNENNNSSGVNTILIVLILIVIVGVAVWVLRGGFAPQESPGFEVDVQLPEGEGANN